MWQYYQAWVDLHEMYVQLYKALIDADAKAWDKLDHVKQAEARVDFLCRKWKQSTYPLEMTEALEEVHDRAHPLPEQRHRDFGQEVVLRPDAAEAEHRQDQLFASQKK